MSPVGRAAFKATRPLWETGANPGKSSPPVWKQVLYRDDQAEAQVLRKGARRDPELYGIYVVTAAVFARAGWRFVQSRTGADYTHVAQVPKSEPWHDDGASGKYKYYPHDDPRLGTKDAPSALNVMIVPNVNLPKFNKYGKPEYDL